MKADFEFKDKYNFNDLVEIIKILRAPGGCPWDAEQTHTSIRENFLEETYEALEAIDTGNKELLKEELGDVLLQVVLHADISRTDGDFDIDDVADGISKKLIIRHPHVFGDVTVGSTDDVLKNWDDIKRKTKNQKTQTDAMNAIPETYPALMKAQKLQSKAKKAGFDWDSADGAFQKLFEEANELKEAVKSGDENAVQDEAGDLLFSAVNVVRLCGAEAETSLELASKKFRNRFSVVEKLASERGIDMKTADLSVLDALWDEAKATLKN